jgi:hypothetical protein
LCGARTFACRVETLLDTSFSLSIGVGTIADAARKSAYATLDQVRDFDDFLLDGVLDELRFVVNV